MTIRAGTRTAVRHAPSPADHRTFGIVDELNCYFDSPAEPNNVHVEIWLPGHLDPDRLRDAVTAMLAGQPRAGARRADRGWWHRDYAWEFPPQAAVDPVSTACWRTEAELGVARARFLATAPPLDRSPPFRLLLARGPGRDSLILNAHHAAFDGRSCLRLLRLIADRYGAGRPAEPDRTDLFRAPPEPPGQPQPRASHSPRPATAPGQPGPAARGTGTVSQPASRRLPADEAVPAAGGAHRADSVAARERPPAASRARLRLRPARMARRADRAATGERTQRHRQRLAHRRADPGHTAVERVGAPCASAAAGPRPDQHAGRRPAARPRRRTR